jgi:elongation factor 2
MCKLLQSLYSKEQGLELYHANIKNKFPLHEKLLGVFVDHVPSPVIAQETRYNLLYTGNPTDKYATAIRECDPNRILILHIGHHIYARGSQSYSDFHLTISKGLYNQPSVS